MNLTQILMILQLVGAAGQTITAFTKWFQDAAKDGKIDANEILDLINKIVASAGAAGQFEIKIK